MNPKHDFNRCPCAECAEIRTDLDARWEDTRPTADELDTMAADYETTEAQENAR